MFISFLTLFSDNTKFGFNKRSSYSVIGNVLVLVKEYLLRRQFSIKAIQNKAAVME